MKTIHESQAAACTTKQHVMGCKLSEDCGPRVSQRRAFLLLAAGIGASFLSGCGGGHEEALEDFSPAELDLPPPPGFNSQSAASDRAEALSTSRSEREIILNRRQMPSWIYYTDASSQRWYISPVDAYSKSVGIYSLGTIVDRQAGWWTVASSGLTGTPSSNMLRVVAGLDRDRSIKFYDIGRRTYVTNSTILKDRLLIQNSKVPVKWYFFSASNGYWYIIAEPLSGSSNPPIIYRFSERNGAYDWVLVDTKGVHALFKWQGNRPGVMFSPVPGYAASVLGKSIDMDGAYGAQCVDLMHHYIAEGLGIAYPHGFTGNAYEIFEDAESSSKRTSTKYGEVTFKKIAKSAINLPEPGDIVFWKAPDPGHVAIVIEAHEEEFTSVDQNWPVGSAVAQVTHSYKDVAGWFRPNW